jgi:hypothetical protein
LRPSVCSPANNQGSVERQKKPTRQVACEITKDGVVTEKSTQLREWDLEAIQAHADFLSLKDIELNLNKLKASRHTLQAHQPNQCGTQDSAIPQSRRKKSPSRFLVRASFTSVFWLLDLGSNQGPTDERWDKTLVN